MSIHARLGAALLAFFCALPLAVRAADAPTPYPANAPAPDTAAPAAPLAPVEGNSLNARTLHIDNARVPGPQSARQSITAWQVVAGSWDGQPLDGLTLVLVKTATDGVDGVGRQIDCYISHVATAAQRRALVNAFLSAQPSALDPRDSSRLRIEPAVITIELNGNTIILHVGLVA